MNNLVEIKNLQVSFDIKRSFLQSIYNKNKIVIKAVDNISFNIKKGEILSLVGESGSGKTTTGRAILDLIEKTNGKILFDSEEISNKNKQWKRNFRKRAQMIFQDPYQSLNPKDMVIDIVAEPLIVNELGYSQEKIKQKVIEALEFAGLKPAESYLYKYPYELSGGQRQRVAIATVFILSPDFIVADEPVSMLDASVRADILKLMVKLRDKNNTSYLFITHDLSLAWLISDRIAIMYLGKIVEIGSYKITTGLCKHPYSKSLISVLPTMEGNEIDESNILKGETPSPTQIPSGCRFHPRCRYAKDICIKEEPNLVEIDKNHYVACHFANKF